MLSLPKLRCAACATVVSGAGPSSFSCPNRDGIGEHILRLEGPPADAALHPHPNPFVRYREMLFAYRLARAQGISDQEYVERTEHLDARIAELDGHGFRTTPFECQTQLASCIGPAACALWLKDETGNVAGSHKARHLMGLALHVQLMRQTGRFPGPRPELAIASCGNAALAAGVVAAALRWPLRVFIPPQANPQVVARLRELGARLEICERRAGAAGDPCYQRFRRATAAGAIPFSCQGPDNALALDGGRTLGFELAEQMAVASIRLDRLFVQIGGGALASSVIAGIAAMARLGCGPRSPVLHAVQTESVHPLARAWRRLFNLASAPPETADWALAAWAGEPRHHEAVAAALKRGIADRRLCMRPWETTPTSVADGIVDDETYDWLAVVEGMLESGGWPVLVSEAQLCEVNRLTGQHTEIAADHTGTAGLAGLLSYSRTYKAQSGESLGVIVTGRRRDRG